MTKTERFKYKKDLEMSHKMEKNKKFKLLIYQVDVMAAFLVGFSFLIACFDRYLAACYLFAIALLLFALGLWRNMEEKSRMEDEKWRRKIKTENKRVKGKN